MLFCLPECVERSARGDGGNAWQQAVEFEHIYPERQSVHTIIVFHFVYFCDEGILN